MHQNTHKEMVVLYHSASFNTITNVQMDNVKWR